MEKHIKAAEFFANFMDNRFELFGVRFGFTLILDLIPELGDIIAALLSLYIVWIALQMELPAIRIFQMLFNIGINLILGLIPIVGEVTYILRKANIKNVKILKKYADQQIIHGEVIS